MPPPQVCGHGGHALPQHQVSRAPREDGLPGSDPCEYLQCSEDEGRGQGLLSSPKDYGTLGLPTAPCCVPVSCLLRGMAASSVPSGAARDIILSAAGIAPQKLLVLLTPQECHFFRTLGRRQETVPIGHLLCPSQPRTPGQPAPGKALVENLCMKAVNQSIGEPGTVPSYQDESLGRERGRGR